MNFVYFLNFPSNHIRFLRNFQNFSDHNKKMAAATTSNIQSRKARGIGNLTQRILDWLPQYPPPFETWNISVDQIMKGFGSTIGSTYEVLHVFEALLLASKIKKDTYRWNGFQRLQETLTMLKFIGRQFEIIDKIRKTRETEAKEIIGSAVRAPRLLPPPRIHIIEVIQRFIMICLHNDKAMTLIFASKVINGADLPEARQKSKARRLYDVSNVMIAIGSKFPLLEKVAVNRINHSMRSAFRYCGPKIDDLDLDLGALQTLPLFRRQRSKYLFFDFAKNLLGLEAQYLDECKSKPIRIKKEPKEPSIRRKSTRKIKTEGDVEEDVDVDENQVKEIRRKSNRRLKLVDNADPKPRTTKSKMPKMRFKSITYGKRSSQRWKDHLLKEQDIRKSFLDEVEIDPLDFFDKDEQKDAEELLETDLGMYLHWPNLRSKSLILTLLIFQIPMMKVTLKFLTTKSLIYCWSRTMRT